MSMTVNLPSTKFTEFPESKLDIESRDFQFNWLYRGTICSFVSDFEKKKWYVNLDNRGK